MRRLLTLVSWVLVLGAGAGAELVREGDSHALLCPGKWKYCEWTHQVGAGQCSIQSHSCVRSPSVTAPSAAR